MALPQGTWLFLLFNHSNGTNLHSWCPQVSTGISMPQSSLSMLTHSGSCCCCKISISLVFLLSHLCPKRFNSQWLAVVIDSIACFAVFQFTSWFQLNWLEEQNPLRLLTGAKKTGSTFVCSWVACAHMTSVLVSWNDTRYFVCVCSHVYVGVCVCVCVC